jgi:hypothetical protein
MGKGGVDRRTGLMKLIVAFSEFVNAPKTHTITVYNHTINLLHVSAFAIFREVIDKGKHKNR